MAEQAKIRQDVRFSLEAFLVWSRWYFVALSGLLLYFPILFCLSLPRVLWQAPRLTFFIVILGLDYWFKRLALDVLADGRQISIIDNWFCLSLAFNKGAAFGLFKGFGWLFILMALATCLFIFVYLALYSDREPLTCWALVCILCGALGNMIDRIEFNHVIDYLLVYHGTWSFPVFNLADIVINVGVFLILFDVLGETWRGRRASRTL